jgi:multiple sugar transport system substrate-binding protein
MEDVVGRCLEVATRRGALRGAALGGAGTVAAACGLGAQPPAESIRSGSRTYTITYLQRSKPADRQPVLDALLAEFTAEVPQVRVEVAVASDIHVVQKALQLHLAGSTADVVEWARDGYDLRDSIIDLKPYLNRDTIATSIFLPSAAELMSRDGKFVGIPASIASDALVYNPDALQRAAVPAPPLDPNNRSWTMERFQEYATKLTQRPDRFGWGGSLSSGFQWMDAATYFGVGVWDAKAEKLLIATPEFRRALQYWTDLYVRYQVVPNAEEATNLPGGFNSGRIAMNVLGQVPTALLFKPGLATLPYSGQGKNVSARISPGSLFAGKAEQVDATWELMRWLLEPRRNATHVKAFGHAVTGVAKANELRRQDVIQETGIDPQAWVLQAAQSKLVGWGLYKYPEAEITARNDIQPRYQSELLTGKISVNEFVLFAEQKLKEAIARGT